MPAWFLPVLATRARNRPRVAPAVVLVAAVPLFLMVPARGSEDSLPNHRFSTGLAEVPISGSVYAIPRNYLVHVAKDHRGKTGVIALRAPWPDLEPLRRDNAHLWDS